MNSSPPTLTGFNNNVRYRGMRFHIQTEDSGVSRPHITTHLFADGGHVIKSLRTDYAEYVDHPERVSVVQRLMREQHRAMALELRDGKLDATIDRIAPPAPDEEAEAAPATQLSARPPAPLASPGRALVGSAPMERVTPPVAVAPAAGTPAPRDAEPSKPLPQRPVEADAPTSRPAASQSSSAVSSGQAAHADSQPLWDTQLRPKNQHGRGRRRSSEPRSSRRAPASSKGNAPRSRAEVPAEKAEPASSKRSESQRGQSQRPSSRSGAASSRPKSRKSDRAASAASTNEAPASSRRSGSTRAARGATGAAEPRAAEPGTSSRPSGARSGSRAPKPDVAEPQPASAPISSRRGRPAAALPAKPAGPSLFGPLPQDSLDDAILTYAARAKTPPSSRGSK
jgi:hypothetical protein